MITTTLSPSSTKSFHVRDMGMHRSSDTDIVKKAMEEGRIALTCDLDFGDIVSASGERCPSVIILRLENETPGNVNRRLKSVAVLRTMGISHLVQIKNQGTLL